MLDRKAVEDFFLGLKNDELIKELVRHSIDSQRTMITTMVKKTISSLFKHGNLNRTKMRKNCKSEIEKSTRVHA